MNKEFLKDIFADRKKLLKKKDVDFTEVTHFDELSVKNLFKNMKEDQNFM